MLNVKEAAANIAAAKFPIAEGYRNDRDNSIHAASILRELSEALKSALTTVNSYNDPVSSPVPHENHGKALPSALFASAVQKVVSMVHDVVLRVGGESQATTNTAAQVVDTTSSIFLACRESPATIYIDSKTGNIASTSREEATLERFQRQCLANLLTHLSEIELLASDKPMLAGPQLTRLYQYASQFGISKNESAPVDTLQALVIIASEEVARGLLSIAPLATALASESATLRSRALIAVGNVVHSALELAKYPGMQPIIDTAVSTLVNVATVLVKGDIFARDRRLLNSADTLSVVLSFQDRVGPLAVSMISGKRYRFDHCAPMPAAPMKDQLALDGIAVLSNIFRLNLNDGLPARCASYCDTASLPELLKTHQLSSNEELSRASTELLDLLS